MSYRLITPPAVEPVGLDEAKTFVRIDHDADDMLIQGLISAAREWCERYSGRSFIRQRWRLTLDQFPIPGVITPGTNYMSQIIPIGLPPAMVGPIQPHSIELLRPPVVSVDLVSYAGSGGDFIAADYLADLDAEPARLWPPMNGSWPMTAPRPAAVRIEYTAGYGADATAVPAAIRSAINVCVARLYENRGDQQGEADDLPQAAKSLLAPYRLYSFGGVHG